MADANARALNPSKTFPQYVAALAGTLILMIQLFINS